MLRDRAVFDEVEELVNDVASFATNLANRLTEFIDRLPSPAELMGLAGSFIKDKLLNDDGLCLASSCPGTHINSGVEEDLVPGSDDLEILASHPITHAYRPPTRYNRAHACRPNTSYARILPHQPPLSCPHCLGHS